MAFAWTPNLRFAAGLLFLLPAFSSAFSANVEDMNRLLRGEGEEAGTTSGGSISDKLLSMTDNRPEFAKLRVLFVRGAGVESNMPTGGFKSPIQNAFGSHKLAFKLNGYDGYSGSELLGFVGKSDIFYINTHSGNSTVVKRQVLAVKPSADNKKFYKTGLVGFRKTTYYVDSDDLRATTKRFDGPRLVIINGCITTAYNNPVGAKHRWRLATGFGIDAKTRGRAYLGWPAFIVGAAADIYLSKLLTNWTTPSEGSRYPTLAQALTKTGPYSKSKSLTIVGDETLRYDFISGYVGNRRVIGKWEITGVEHHDRKKGPKVTDEWNGTTLELSPDGKLTADLLYNDGKKKSRIPIRSFKGLKELRWFLSGDDNKPRLAVMLISTKATSVIREFEITKLTATGHMRILIPDQKETYYLARVR